MGGIDANPIHVADQEESGKAGMSTSTSFIGPRQAARKPMLFLTVLTAVILSLATAIPARADFGIASFSAELVDTAGNPLDQAGSHPDLVTDIRFNTMPDPHFGGLRPDEQLKNLEIVTPPGFYGDPTTPTECTAAQFMETFAIGCPSGAQVGFAEVQIGEDPSTPFSGYWPAPVYNITPQDGDVATFAFMVFGVATKLGVTVNTDGDYSLTTSILNANEGLPVYGSRVTLWGVPADPAHDALRWEGFLNGNHPSGAPRRAFLTSPARCDASLSIFARARSWEHPERWVSATDTMPGMSGCDQLSFGPAIDVHPASSEAGVPTAYDVSLEIPQNSSLTTPATPLLRKAAVSLPEGVSVNSSSAQGLGSCSDEQMAPQSKSEPSCPSSSKIGTVSIETPVLSSPLEGEVILGTPKHGQLFRLWLVARGSGILLKLPGSVQPDSQTGQLRATFSDTPQLPFEGLHLHFKGGDRAVLVNPDTCGIKVTTTEMVPWGGPTATPNSSFQITGCSNRFSPELEAGSEDPLAGASSPFQLRITRNDREQKLGSIDLTLPPGQLAKLRGVSYCPDATLASISGEEGAAAAEAATPSCPEASQVGSTLVGTGAGANPLYVGGKAYLAGPYKGAPLSIAFVTPALAGPFDLGNVVVRSALKVDPVTAQVEAVSDPLPTILHGVPLDLKDIRVSLDRPDFTVNPTSCREMQVSGQVTSSTGTAADVSNRYQLGDCASLGFKPRLSLRLSGQTHRSAHPALTAVLKARKGDANIGKAVVTLPKTEFLENAHIRTVCTRVQYAADNCPKGSIYGYAKAWSPLLDQPLQGPVYLRSSNHTLPDLVASLDGQIHIDLDGRIDSVNGRIRNTFEAVPDAPVSKFVLNMQGGKKGLLVNNTELCGADPRVSVKFTGHNGKHSSSNPLVKTGCGKKHGR